MSFTIYPGSQVRLGGRSIARWMSRTMAGDRPQPENEVTAGAGDLRVAVEDGDARGRFLRRHNLGHFNGRTHGHPGPDTAAE